jgi:hypothetical protein
MTRALLAVLVLPAFAAAQPTPTDTLTGTAPAIPPPAPAGQLSDPEPALWSFDLLVGAPLAVRGTRRIDDTRWAVEAGVGLYLIFPTAFAGVRYDGHVYTGRRHAVRIRPGLDAAVVVAYSLFGRDKTVGVVQADADFVWQRPAADGGAMELGLKLGVGVPVTRGTRGVYPLAALLFGFAF